MPSCVGIVGPMCGATSPQKLGAVPSVGWLCAVPGPLLSFGCWDGEGGSVQAQSCSSSAGLSLSGCLEQQLCFMENNEVSKAPAGGCKP